MAQAGKLLGIYFIGLAMFFHCTVHEKTRMHSNRMGTACSSSRLLGGCLPQCMLGYFPGCGSRDPPPCVALGTLWVWAWRPSTCGSGDPPGVGLETPPPTPQARLLNFPPGCGPGDLQCMLGYPLWTNRHL